MARVKTLESIMRELYQVSGFRICIYDLKRNEVCAWPKEMSPFCRRIQQNASCLNRCRQNDTDAFDKVQQTGEAEIYRCHAGLYEAVAPLYDRERLSGFLMMGQTLDSMKQSRQEVLQYSRQYIEDQEIWQEAVLQIPDRTKIQILSCISIMEICASYITLSNRFQVSEEELPHKVIIYIQEHYHEEISLDRLCRIFYCSRAKLTSSFRRVYLSSIHQYLMKYRLERSCDLLNHAAYTIADAARLSGFSEQNYFAKAFKKQYGISPSDYRKSKNWQKNNLDN